MTESNAGSRTNPATRRLITAGIVAIHSICHLAAIVAIRHFGPISPLGSALFSGFWLPLALAQVKLLMLFLAFGRVVFALRAAALYLGIAYVSFMWVWAEKMLGSLQFAPPWEWWLGEFHKT